MNPTRSCFLLAALAVLAAAGGPNAGAQDSARPAPVDFSAFKIITERNIFDPNRRPVRPNAPRAERPVVDSFALTGTMSYSNVVLAVFDGSKPDYHQALKAGDQIAGHAVTAIAYDGVKLTAGTNQLELKVGMQMRRSEDGSWSVAESSGTYGSAPASSSRRRDSDRRDNSSRRTNSNRPGSPASPQTPGAPGEMPAVDAAAILMPGMPAPGEAEAMPAPPPEEGGASSDDPVARMMARRLQETGGDSRNQSDNEN